MKKTFRQLLLTVLFLFIFPLFAENSVRVDNSFSHSIAKERPSFSYGMLVAGSYNAPWNINVNAQAGFFYISEYGREDTNADGTIKSVSSYMFDGNPFRISSRRVFTLPWNLKIAPTAGISIPITSYYYWGFIENRASANVGTSLSRTFKVAKKFSMKLALSGNYTHSFDSVDAIFGKNTGDLLWYRTRSDVLSDSLAVTFNYTDFSLDLLFRQDFNKSYKNEHIENVHYSAYDGWQLQHTYALDLGYSFKDFTFGAGVQTSGKFFKFGNYGSDALVPFDPEFTQVTATIGYNYTF